MMTMASPYRMTMVIGVFWLLLSTLLMTIALTIAKWVGPSIHPVQMVFIRYASGLITLVVVVVVLSARNSAPFVRSKRLNGHVARAIFGAGGVGLSMYAVIHIPLVDASAIALTRGAFVVILAGIFLRETITITHFLAAAICILGAFIISGYIGPTAGLVSSHFVPSFAALLGAFMIAVEIILIKMLSSEDPPLTIIVYVHIIAVFILIVPTILLWRPLAIADGQLLLLMGPISVAAQFCSIQAYRKAEASVLAPVPYTRVIFAAIIGLVIFDDQFGVRFLVGSALIATGSIGLLYIKNRNN